MFYVTNLIEEKRLKKTNEESMLFSAQPRMSWFLGDSLWILL